MNKKDFAAALATTALLQMLLALSEQTSFFVAAIYWLMVAAYWAKNWEGMKK